MELLAKEAGPRGLPRFFLTLRPGLEGPSSPPRASFSCPQGWCPTSPRVSAGIIPGQGLLSLALGVEIPRSSLKRRSLPPGGRRWAWLGAVASTACHPLLPLSAV